ncbi:MAG: YggS family pyridoxal phosphate-dependent enzyme [Fidelibacterota bacterium]
MSIYDNVKKMLAEIPENITVIAAAKTRDIDEVKESIDAGIKHIGENYVQELEYIATGLGDYRDQVTMHVIGHLQSNKINKALEFCDVIQTIDSIKRARKVNKRVPKFQNKPIPVLIEINIADEENKHGARPDFDEIADIATAINGMEHLRLEGLMTLGPFGKIAEELRPYFRQMKVYFDQLKELNLSNTDIKTLSMGMTESYQVAIEEGATMVRLGRVLYGERE